jgi:hypothetical protein
VEFVVSWFNHAIRLKFSKEDMRAMQLASSHSESLQLKFSADKVDTMVIFVGLDELDKEINYNVPCVSKGMHTGWHSGKMQLGSDTYPTASSCWNAVHVNIIQRNEQFHSRR